MPIHYHFFLSRQRLLIYLRLSLAPEDGENLKTFLISSNTFLLLLEISWHTDTMSRGLILLFLCSLTLFFISPFIIQDPLKSTDIVTGSVECGTEFTLFCHPE